jgi:thiamine transporter ThiT
MENQTTTPAQPSGNLQVRVRNILTKPKEEWAVIAAEPKDIAGIYRNYIVLLAAIPCIAMALGMTVIGIPVPLIGHVRVPFGSAFANELVTYVLSLVGVYLMAFVVVKLAPYFQSEPDIAQAVKLVAYSWTPAWVAGVLLLYPGLAPIVGIAGLYGIYLIYLGVGPLMKTPPDKAIVYLVVSAVAAIVIYFVIAMIAGTVFPIAVAPRAFY